MNFAAHLAKALFFTSQVGSLAENQPGGEGQRTDEATPQYGTAPRMKEAGKAPLASPTSTDVT